MFEDGDFDDIEFSYYDLIQNAELDMDDVDRNWCVLDWSFRASLLFFANIKNI